MKEFVRDSSFQYLSDDLDPGFVPVRNPAWKLGRKGSSFRLRAAGSSRSILCNESIAIIWELSNGTRSTEQILRLIASSFDVADTVLAEELARVLGLLVSFGAIDPPQREFPLEHSIVTWDCSFREMFHLLSSLASCRYDLDKVEVILVEQRSQAVADARAAGSGVMSAQEVAEAVQPHLTVRVLYLNEPDDIPYHPGRLLNAGITASLGRIVSTMDGDVLVPVDFLSALDEYHRRPDRIATMFRHQSPRPRGITLENWTRQEFDYHSVLALCRTRDDPVPERVSNKAPLLSAHRNHWYAIGGYDGHRVFSSAYTLFGTDVSLRFKLLLGDNEGALPVACVHPWHPTEINRASGSAQTIFGVQKLLLKWTCRTRQFDVRERQAVADNLLLSRQQSLDRTIIDVDDRMRQSTRDNQGIATISSN